MKESFKLKVTLNATAEAIYSAWLDSTLHTSMTGGDAVCSAQVESSFSAWDGYISGKNLQLTPYSKIKQSWRTSEFDLLDEDSLLEIEFNTLENGQTEITLIHSEIPEGQTQYKQGWIEHYFEPMSFYFDNN